nr:MFS transporter [Actinoplanes lichenis]
MVALTATVVGTLIAASFAGSYGWLLAALALAGIGQALANPATNVLVRARVPAPADGDAIGYKQAGVQVSALLSGLVLPAVAAAHGWQWALRVSAAAALVVAATIPWVRAPAPHPAPPKRPPLPGWLLRLALFCFVLATANAAVATYLPLFAAQDLGYRPRVAGGVLACFGLAGVAGRIWWTRRTARRESRPAALLTPLAALAALSTVPLVLATLPHLGALVWAGALGVGSFAVAAYAIAMLDVVRNTTTGTGRASGVVSVGFFLGFAVGPVSFGLVADHAGYRAAWSAVAAVLVLATVAGLPFRRV